MNATVEQLRNAPAKTEDAKTFPGMLKQFQSEIERALPKHLSGDRMCRIALTCFRTTPKLAKCDPASVFAAVIKAAQLGLEPGLTAEAHLIPYGKECQLIPGYAGLVKLAMNTGRIDSINAQPVYQNDEFELAYTTEADRLVHRPNLDNDRGELRLVYAIARIKDSSNPHIDFMTRGQIEAIRNNSSGYKNAVKYNNDNPWTNPDQVAEMWRKTMLRRICKQLPKSPELAEAIALDTIAELGKPQQMDVHAVIEGDYTPMVEDDETPDSEAKVSHENISTPEEISPETATGDAPPNNFGGMV